MRTVTCLSALALMLATAGCTYSDMGVGKGCNISAEQMRAYAFDQSGGDLPVPAVDHPGKGMAVQMDRMVTAQLEFTDGDGNPAGTGTVRFIHYSHDKSLSRWGGTPLATFRKSCWTRWHGCGWAATAEYRSPTVRAKISRPRCRRS